MIRKQDKAQFFTCFINQKYQQMNLSKDYTSCDYLTSPLFHQPLQKSQDQYISQFLTFFDHSTHNLTPNFISVLPHTQQMFSKTHSHSDPSETHNHSDPSETHNQSMPLETQNQSVPSGQPKKRSEYQNFQKHLIITIRKATEIEIPKVEEPWVKATKEIWKIFRQTKKCTKQLLSAVTHSKVPTKILQKYGLASIGDQYGEQQFEKSQNFIKNQILKSFDKKQIDSLLEGRKISKKKQFGAYLQTVIHEIAEGTNNQRFNGYKTQN